MNPEECIVGMLVQYAPSPGHWFTGVIAYEPWQLGCGTWVTKLRDMEDGYGEFTGKHGDKAHAVFAASLNSMRPMPKQLGTPISELSGRPGHAGFAEFSRIARSWGYE